MLPDKTIELLYRSEDIRSTCRKLFQLLLYDVRDFETLFNFEISQEDIITIISSCMQIRAYLEKNRPHENDPPPKKQLKPYRLFMRQCKGSIQISEKNFNRVYNALDGIKLDGRELETDKKSSIAATELISTGLSRAELTACILDLYVSHSPDLIEYNHPVTGQNPGTMRAVADKVLKQLGNNMARWLDTLCILTTNPDSNDVEIENTFAYYSFTSRLRNLSDNIKTACIIEPSLFFIKKWAADPYVRDVPTNIYIHGPIIAFYLQNMFENAANIHIKDIDQLNTDLSSCVSDAVLIFGNRIPDRSSKEELVKKIISHSRTDHTLFILDTDHTIRYFLSQLSDVIDPKKIDLLPDGIHYCTRPKRKMLLSAKYGYLKERDSNIHITSLKLINRAAYQRISAKCTDIYIPREELLSCRSLRQRFSDAEYQNLAKTDKKRQGKIGFSFSDEIFFNYSVKIIAGAYVINVNPYIIDSAGKRVSLPHLNIENAPLKGRDPQAWLADTFLYKTKSKKDGSRINIREAITEKLKEVYAGSPVTLKTYIYMHPEVESAYPDAGIKIVRKLMDSPLGEMYPRDINVSHLESFLSEFNGSKSMTLSILVDIFQFAQKHKHVFSDPASELYSNLYDRFRELDEVRTALAKQFLPLAEVRSIISECKQKAPHSLEHLAVLFRFLAGLEPSVISALSYSDFQIMVYEGTAFNTVHIEKKLSSSEAALIPVSRTEQCRVIPLPKFISALIEERKAGIRTSYPGITDDQLGLMPVFEGKDVLIDASVSVISPGTIRRISKGLFNSLDIESKTISVPDNKYRIEETDLSKYGGDICRNTYRHYLVRETVLNEDEIKYLLGTKKTNLDYNNYIDCGERNIRKQYRMYCAVQIISDLFESEDEINGK